MATYSIWPLFPSSYKVLLESAGLDYSQGSKFGLCFCSHNCRLISSNWWRPIRTSCSWQQVTTTKLTSHDLRNKVIESSYIIKSLEEGKHKREAAAQQFYPKPCFLVLMLVTSGCKLIPTTLGIPATFGTQRARKSKNSFRITAPHHRLHVTCHQWEPDHKANLRCKGCWESQYVASQPLLHEVAERRGLKVFPELANHYYHRPFKKFIHFKAEWDSTNRVAIYLYCTKITEKIFF